MIMKKEVTLSDAALQQAAEEGMDAFLSLIIGATKESIGGELTAENMAGLSADQLTLLAWDILHEEVMGGGYVQLIYNGYGAFIFRNPLAKAFRNWGIDTLAAHLKHAFKPYEQHHAEIEQERTDEEFMALFEQMPEFDDYDDEFVEREEEWTSQIAIYVDDHLTDFIQIEK